MWLALIPIIVLEAVMVARSLGVPLRPVLAGTALANLASTVVGVPVLWSLLAAVEGIYFGSALGLSTLWTKLYAVTVQAPWLIPCEGQFYWMIPAALAVLAVPFYVLSVVIETPIIRRIAALPRTTGTRKAVWQANLASYAGLGLLIAIATYFDWKALFYQGPMQPAVDAVLALMGHIAGLLPMRP